MPAFIRKPRLPARRYCAGSALPSWLACALAGILGAVLVRLVFIPLGLDDMLPVRLPVYVAIAAAIGFLVSLLGFGR